MTPLFDCCLLLFGGSIMNRRTMFQTAVKFVVALGILGSLMAAGGAPLDFAGKPKVMIQP
jgi:hypothetical protein